MRIRLLLILTTVFCFVSFAHAGALPYAGVWAGTIGKQAVRVCFVSPDDSQYFYQKRLRGIRLLSEGATNGEGVDPVLKWKEVLVTRMGEESTGVWELAKPAEGALAGTWRKPQSGEGLDIKLHKVGELEDQSCGAEFYRPIEAAASAITRDWDVFRLSNEYKGAARYNQFVQSWLAENAVENYRCQLRYGQDRQSELVQETLTDKVLVVRETLFDVYCGGTHNESDTSYHFFDPRTGTKLDPWRWIRGGEEAGQSASRLRVLIEKLTAAAQKNSDCANTFDVAPPIPTKKGFEFSTRFSWALRVCDGSVVVAYDKLRPYLTAEGKAVAADFLAH